MGLGAYLAAVTDRDHYISEEQRERREIANNPGDEKEEIYETMGKYHVDRAATMPLVEELVKNPDSWVMVSSREFRRRVY